MSKAAAGHLRAYDADALRTQSRADFVYDSLRDAIWEGRFAHGERLREEEIASALGVSRTPVREAMGQLQAQGLVVIRPQVGSFVFTPSADDITARGRGPSMACEARNCASSISDSA